MESSQPLDTLIGRDELRAVTGLDPATIYRQIKVGRFPQPIKIGLRRVAWRTRDIARWQDTRPQGVGPAPVTRGK